MSDLPIPQSAAGAGPFAECWDAVLSYADLCADGSAAAARLATEALARRTREAGGTGSRTASGPAHRPVRLLPRVPLLLTAVRATAAAWEAGGRGDDLTPGLRLWLRSGPAARHTGPAARRPLALRALRGLPPADAELLWLAEVEALPLPVVARRLGLDPAAVTAELAQARALFRDRCRRGHLDGPPDDPCAPYARLLAGAAASGTPVTPDDISRHLARCAGCAEAAGCLRTDPGSLPAALADGVLGWGGLAYLERRRRAAEARLAAALPAPAYPDDGPPDDGSRRTRAVRRALLSTAVLASLLALTASLRPFGDADASDTLTGTPATPADRGRPSAPPTPASPPTPGPTSTPAPRPAPAGSESATPLRTPAPRTSAPRTSEPRTTTQAVPSPPSCRAHYDLVTQWPAGFQATVTVATARPLDTWRVTWSFPDGQRVGRMWDATLFQSGPHVTATAAPYNATVPAGGTLTFGFLASWEGRNGGPEGVALNGRPCAVS
ncbi:cellulose binding domain-containing protein [Streptomyces griseoviridis]|uniref:CBM2 domain-containing protein n=1 Tax=Streptomyces griseoviridis TaxID=45398 RepID=A0ABT9LMT3_STRGD|nr:cellulose binding domain-containing protein [Streptomyces griseoviridis]MDP9684834.1 hypothetical protein [Streptomyces griseoviridis]GGT19585.1 hypothetical protein GCM10010240_60710 [Streptomyces griseoviridis]